MMSIAIHPQQLFRWLILCIVTLVFLHVLAVGAALAFPSPGREAMRAFFDLNAEGNLPAKYSTLQLAFSALLLLLLHREARLSSRPGGGFWLALAGIFLFLAADEYYMIHERLSGPVISRLGAANVPSFAWVIPYAALVAAFAASFFRFWWQLPRAIRRQMAVAALIYVGGSMGMEEIGSRIYESLGKTSPWYLLEVVVEESMEMIGIALFIRTLATTLQARVGVITFQLGSRVLKDHGE